MGEHKGDFAADFRLLRITAIAAVGGVLSTLAAGFLLDLIRLFSNLFFFQTISTANRSPLRASRSRRCGANATLAREGAPLRDGEVGRKAGAHGHVSIQEVTLSASEATVECLYRYSIRKAP